MSFVALVVCLVIALRRRRRGVTIVVPAILGGLALVGSIDSLLGLVASFQAVAQVNPADKATILAASISEAINSFAFWLMVEIPLLIGSYFLDRRLRRRQMPIDGRMTKHLVAHAAPPGSACSNHADRAASLICLRCGAFTCGGRSALDQKHCKVCFQKG